jgi:hypothetical protein
LEQQCLNFARHLDDMLDATPITQDRLWRTIVERCAACMPTGGALDQHLQLREMRKTPCFSYDASPD